MVPLCSLCVVTGRQKKMQISGPIPGTWGWGTAVGYSRLCIVHWWGNLAVYICYIWCGHHWTELYGDEYESGNGTASSNLNFQSATPDLTVNFSLHHGWVIHLLTRYDKALKRCLEYDHWKGLSRGNCTPNQKLAGFVFYLKIINTFLKNNICILKQIIQATQKWHWNFSRPSSSKVMDQSSQNIVFINNSRTAWPT